MIMDKIIFCTAGMESYAIKPNRILTTEYTEYTELIRRVFLPCIWCLPWFIQYESS